MGEWSVVKQKTVSLFSLASENCGGSVAVPAPRLTLAAWPALSKELMWGPAQPRSPHALGFQSAL